VETTNSLEKIAARYLKEIELAPSRKPNLPDTPLPWRPCYLQRRVLAAFGVIFAALIVILEALQGYSERNAGIGDTSQPGRYFWACGPPAALTIVAAAWHRVDYQSRHSAPWIRLSIGPAAADKTLLLDYLNTAQPWVIISALQNRDMAVACIAAVALLLKLLVLVSTSLASVSIVDLGTQSVAINLATAFVDNTAGLADIHPFAILTTVTLLRDDIAFPEGTSRQYAYQQVTSDLPIDTNIWTTVDGYSAGLDCQTASFLLNNVDSSLQPLGGTATMTSPGCNLSILFDSNELSKSTNSNGTGEAYFFRLGQGGCGNSTNSEDQRVVAVAGRSSVASGGGILQSAQIMCKPVHNISRVDIVRNSTALLSISPSSPPAYRVPSNVQPWDVAQAFLSSHNEPLGNLLNDTTLWWYNQTENLDADTAMVLALQLQYRINGSLTSPSSLLNAAALQAVTTTYYQQLCAIIASRALMQQNVTTSLGNATLTTERFAAHSFATHFMAAILGLALCLTATATFLIPRKGFLPRDPGTVIDMAALIAHSRPLLQALRGTGGSDTAAIRELLLDGSEYFTGVDPYERAPAPGLGYFKILGGPGPRNITLSDYTPPSDKFPYPFLMHPIQRVLAYLLVVGLIVSLELILYFSQRNAGIGYATDDTYQHYLWTLGPAFLFAIPALYFASTDLTTRSLAPFATLSRGSSFEESMMTQYANKTGIAAIYQAFRMRNLAVIGSTAALLVSSLFTIFSATLYSASTILPPADVNLNRLDFFSENPTVPSSTFCIGCQNGTMLASLILGANMSYPALTYTDLIYPNLTLSSISADFMPPDHLRILATVPVHRSSMACRKFRQSELTLNITQASFTVVMGSESSGVMTINTTEFMEASIEPSTLPSQTYFGMGQAGAIDVGNGSLSRWLYAWGQIATSGTEQVTILAVSALACNESMEQVNAQTSFIGSNLVIDSHAPPVPDEATVVPIPLLLGDTLMYSELASPSTPYLLDGFFGNLVSSRFAIPVTSLADPGMLDAVASAITQQHKIIRAQIVNAENRQPILATSQLETRGTTASNMVVPATLTSSALRSGTPSRVVQDPVATRILQGLLAVALLLSIVSWAALPKPNILPRSPTSIASVAALLADGNLFGLLGRAAEWQQPSSSLAVFFRDGLHVTMGFQLSWERLRRRRREETLANWGMMSGNSQAEGQAFAIRAVRTGGWGGGEGAGLGLQARVGHAHRGFVKDWGWRT
jgi:hypothetical protein